MKNQLLKASLAYVLLAGLFLFSSCKENVVRGKGSLTTETRQVQSFDKIIIDVAIDATIVVGGAHSMEIKAKENLHDHIKTEVNGTTLRIYNDDIIYNRDDITATIHLPTISMLEINGAADAVVKGDVKGPNFELKVFGASEVDIEQVHVDSMSVNLSGASELKIAGGTAGAARYKVTGAGEIRANGVETKNATAKVSGAGEMDLFVTEKLDADITGAGEINYKGHPQITSDVTGAGELIDKN